MAEQESAEASPFGRHARHTEADERPSAAREAEPRSGPRPGDRSGIQWWETCGGWSVRYAMGTF